MESPHGAADAPLSWRKLHAFGLPGGSIRAILAILIFATVWGLILLKPGREVPDFLRDLLFIILGHYFAVRRRASAESEVGPPPLYLPRGTVRIVTVAGFAAVGILLYRRGQLAAIDRSPGVWTLVLVAGFLLGVVVAQLAAWFRDRGHRPPRFVEDLRALFALGAAVVLVVLVWNRFLPEYAPPRVSSYLGQPRLRIGGYGPEHALAAVIGFYFGSRS